MNSSSLSLGVGLIDSSFDNSRGGFNISLDISTKLNKNLISFYLNSGSQLKVFDAGAEEEYTEINATYGREIELNSWIKVEGHIGLGFFNYSVKNRSTDWKTEKESTIGFPFRVKLIFYTSKHFGIGINPNMNLNSLVNIYSGNIIFQYKF
ncbi:hypothetical protein A9Q86_15615 [Flavobacteriales bacterium 33_180_T64]|nr:hypothetical protein A9Q86_15615 [Flavobacteriales bacterium 33_180_T64]